MKFPALGDNPGDVTTCAALEAGIAPTADEKATRAIAIDVGDSTALNEVFLLLSEAGAIRLNAMDKQLASSPVAHHGHVVVLCGPTRFIEKHGSRTRSASHIAEGRNYLACVALEELGVTVLAGLNFVDKSHIPTTAVIGVATSVQIHEGVDRYIVDVT